MGEARGKDAATEPHTDSLLLARLRRSGEIGLWLPAAMGTLTFARWSPGHSLTPSSGRGAPQMLPSTALCFVAVAVLARALPRAGATGRRWIAAAAAFVLAVSLLSVLGGATGLTRLAPPWRISPITSFCFSLTTAALLFMALLPGRALSWVQALLLSSLFTSFVVLTNYLFTGHALYAMRPFTTMSFRTAVLFVVTSSCLLLFTLDRGFLRIFALSLIGSRALRRLFPSVAASVMALAWLFYRGLTAGLFGTNLGVSLLVACLLLVILLTMIRITTGMNEGDLAKMAAFEKQRSSEEERSLALLREASAHKSSQLKTDFLASMSHEIRTPLNGILGMTDALLDTSLSPQQLGYLRTVKNSGETLLEIVNDVLDLSKIEAGRAEVERTAFSLHQLVENVMAEQAWAASRKAVELRWRPAANLPATLIGAPKEIRHALANLVANAVKFTPSGSVTIEARMLRSEGEGAVAELAVEDTGVGIDESELPKLFAPFSQTGAATGYGGYGLGLFLCRSFVEAMGGEIGVSSRRGEGARFWFTFPVEPAKVVSTPERADGPIAARSCPLRPRVLIAEDQDINRRVIARYMEKLGCRARIVTNGHEAAAAAAREDFDAVFLDIHMPEMDGFAATRAIRSVSGARGRVPVIALTARALSGDRERCLRAGMDDYLTKPIHPARLAALLEKWVGGIRAAAPSPGGEAFRAPEGEPAVTRIDLRQLGELRALERGDQLLASMLTRFRENIPLRLQAIDSSLAKSDASGVRRDIHALKSSASYFGALEIDRLCDEIDRCAAQGRLEAVSPMRTPLEEECGKAVEEIEASLSIPAVLWAQESRGSSAAPEAPAANR